MAFREKMVWGSLAATLVIWGWYFLGFVEALNEARFQAGREVGNFLFAVVALIVVQIVVAVLLAVASPREARLPADDRERGFDLLAYRPAFITLSALVATLTVV